MSGSPGVLLTVGLLAAVPAVTAPPATAQSAAPLAVRFELITNVPEDRTGLSAVLTLTNRSVSALPASGWTLWFNFGRALLPETAPGIVELRHVDGDLYALSPTGAFAPLAPGDSLRLELSAQDWVIKESDAPDGFYLVWSDGRPPLPLSDVSVAAFVAPRQTSRGRTDQLAVPTPRSRFEAERGLRRLDPDELVPILPTPRRIERGAGRVALDASWEIRHEPALASEARHLAAGLAPTLGAVPPVGEGGGGPRTLHLSTEASLGPEAYRLGIGSEAVALAGGDAAGVFYAVQSLLAVVGPDGALPELRVEDAPRFAYRGMHLDVARHFHSRATVEKLLDLMALYKLNRFHFHLTDDEGWRLEIAPLPELTAVGGRRGHTVDESDRLVPTLGSGPDPDASHGSGFYSREEFVGLLRHAAARHIEVIPEIDVPGHARAAIRAMEARHARLSAQGREVEAETYRLRHPQDTSRYESVQRWRDNVIDVCQEPAYRFLRVVVDEIVAMYSEAGAPLRAIHVGGDEVPRGAWEGSPACAALVERGAIAGVEDLPDYFLERVAGLLGEHGLITAGWEEIALTEAPEKRPNPRFLDRGFRAHVWNNVWGWGGEDVGYRLANAGYPVVLSLATHLYFDLAWDKDPQEPGYYWAGFIDARKPWELEPLDLFRGVREDHMGRRIDPATYRGHTRLTPEGRENVLGIQGQLWGENAKGPALLEYLVFPRLLALAERAWAAAPEWAGLDDGDARRGRIEIEWNAFANRLGQRELPRLDRAFGGVAYRLPPPGAVVEDGVLQANVAFPGLEIRYTTDGRDPTATSTLYRGPVAVSGPVRLRSFDTRGRGSRVSIVPE